ncbi:MAG: DNA alkylation repair protein [Chitinophagaceae bacterium]|nr:MAG: DNA alkylation repair protein [Chitinophagaceae bacterium]
MALIKDIYNESFYSSLASIIKKVKPGFKPADFLKQAMSPAFRTMEWKERMAHTTQVLHGFLPADFGQAMDEIRTIISQLRKEGTNGGLEYIFFADYIPRYGLDDYKTSVKAMESVTQFISCEFAVRAFLIRYPEKMNAQMLAWSKHKERTVRRLSTEGFRPRLPWAIAVPALKKDPSPILPVLENLKADTCEIVRRSVANNLNDIAKDHPSVVLSIFKKWKGHSPETDAIIRHGSRTLLKQGHSEILDHFGLSAKNISVGQFTIHTPKVKTGGDLQFSFLLHNKNKSTTTIRLEYVIGYLRANGSHGKKVFKISEKPYPGGFEGIVSKQHSFRIITTKTFYPGLQLLSLQVNGKDMAQGTFNLTT